MRPNKFVIFRKLFLGLFVLALGLFVAPMGMSQTQSSLKQEIQNAKEEVYPALVNLTLVKRYFRSGTMRKKPAVGSGVIISPDGYAVTNFHVVDRTEKVEGSLSNNVTLDARIIGKDPLTDLAVIKFDPDDLPAKMEEFPRARLGDSDKVDVGDYVLAMGSPLSMAQSVTLGIVSNDRRVFFSEEGENKLRFGKNLQTGLFTEWIQHDASISGGSSGGPLVNLEGTVVGINARGATSGGDMGFSIPSNQVRRIVEGLKEQGRITRSWIGLGARPVKETRYETGVVVRSVVEGAPADKHGVRPGDHILAVNGEPVNVRFTEQLAGFYRRLAEIPVADEAVLTLRRNGSTKRLPVTTEPLNNRRARKTSLKRWGFNIREISPFYRRLKTGEDTGAGRITSISSGGPAENARPALRSGDLIHSINRQSVTSFEELLKSYRSLTTGETDPSRVLLGLYRDGSRVYSVLEPESVQSIREQPRSLSKAWLGVETQVMTRTLRDELAIELEHGVRVTRIYPNTPASKSSLRVGDIIVRVNDKAVDARHGYQNDLFATMIQNMSVGKTVRLRVFRQSENNPITIDAELDRAPLRFGEVSSYRENTFDFTVREMTFFDRVRWNWPRGTDGVMVKSIETGGWAGVAGLQANDLVTSVDETPLTTVRDLRRAFQSVIREKPRSFPITVRRRNERWQLIVEPDWYDSSPAGNGE